MDSQPTSDKHPDLSMLVIDKDKEPERYHQRQSPWIPWAVFGVVALALVGGFFAFRNQLFPPTVKTLSIQIPTALEARALLTASGYVVAQREADLSAKQVGTIIYLGVEEGSRVTKGQVLARLDVRDLNAQLKEARAQVSQGEKDLVRLQKLHDKGFTPFVDVERGESQLEVNIARKEFIEAQIENTIIRAPFGGVITQKNAEIGELITTLNPSTPGIVRLVDMDSLLIEADVSEASLHRISEGQPAQFTIDSFPGETFRGRLRQIVPTADRQKATVMVKVEFLPDSEEERIALTRILPDMTAQVTFLRNETLSGSPAKTLPLFIPKEALASSEKDMGIVYLLVGEDKVQKRQIAITSILNGKVEVASGLNDGDRVIVSDVARLKGGMKVKVKT